MATVSMKAEPADAAVETPWYDLIDDPEPPEDAMQQASTISDVMSVLRTGEYYGEPLVGERLVNGEYERIELHSEANGDIWSRSDVLGVDFYYRLADDDEVGRFLLRDSVTGEWLNTLSDEIAAHAKTEAARAEAEAARVEAEAAQAEAEARNRELLAELERLRRMQQD